MSEWQPIENAPKDGMLILICGLLYNKGPGRWMSVAGWCSDVGDWRSDPEEPVDLREFYPPTHWMPLPAPPAAIGHSETKS